MALKIGAMMWAGRDTIAEMKALGAVCGQLGVGGDYELSEAAIAYWKTESAAHDFAFSTVVCAYNGEDYADQPTVQRTVGFIPPAARAEREARTLAASDFGAALGITSVACHIGFVPEDAAHPDYIAVREMVRRVCDHAARHGQTFVLETGQEPAHTLLHFLKDTARPNLGINFDPANMILYGTGDPIEALRILAPHVKSVHAKDGDWPPAGVATALGHERPLGQGSVGMERFVAALREIGFEGSLNIEREGVEQDQRLIDMRLGAELLAGLI